MFGGIYWVFVCALLRGKLCKACWPMGDELCNVSSWQQAFRMEPFLWTTSQVPRLLEHRAACVYRLVETSYLKIDTSSVGGEMWRDWMWRLRRPPGWNLYVRLCSCVHVRETCSWLKWRVFMLNKRQDKDNSVPRNSDGNHAIMGKFSISLCKSIVFPSLFFYYNITQLYWESFWLSQTMRTVIYL